MDLFHQSLRESYIGKESSPDILTISFDYGNEYLPSGRDAAAKLLAFVMRSFTQDELFQSGDSETGYSLSNLVLSKGNDVYKVSFKEGVTVQLNEGETRSISVEGLVPEILNSRTPLFPTLALYERVSSKELGNSPLISAELFSQ